MEEDHQENRLELIIGKNQETEASPRRDSSQKRHREILEATRILLSEEGYDALSLRKIAQKVGIHLKTLQHYFPNKNELIRSTLSYTDLLYVEASTEIALQSDQPEERFKSYVRFLIDDDKNQQTAGFFYQLWARAHVDDFTNQVMHKMYRSHTQNIEELIKLLNPDLSTESRRQRAVMIAALIEGMMLFVGYGKQRMDSVGDVESAVVDQCFRIAVGDD
jgi:AcrR family transcriptional regulator